jgi:carbamoyltransferase
MRVLGISDNHNAGAALVIDGRLVAAVNEERIIREKNALTFPAGAIAETLRVGGLEPREAERIVVAGEITPSFLLRALPAMHQRAKRSSGQFGPLFNLYTYYQSAARRLGWPYRLDRDLSARILTKRLRALGFRAPLRTREHHQAHAESAFLTSPFERALIVTADAMGDGVTATVSLGHPDGLVERLFAQSGLAALNPYYTRITETLGFIANRHEGKVTGLAARGDPRKLAPLFRRTLRFVRPGFSTLGNPWRQHRRLGWHRQLWAESKEDVAAACQLVLEEAMGAFVDHWARRTGIADLALAGGIFENVLLNQRLRELPSVRRVWVFPNMGDGGLAVGAALAIAGAKPAPLAHVFLGPDYGEDEIRTAVERAGLPLARPDNLPERIAELLAGGEAVPRFVGRMEYGPRALGNRTVYCRANDPTVNDWLNRMLDRSEFMPFAPIITAEAADRCFVGLDGARDAAHFMTMCFACTDYMKQTAPGAVHVDGSARPQVVGPDDNADAYAILKAYERLTGSPVLLNTSFNRHEEPIVMTPDHALAAFRAAGFRHLAIGPFLVEGRAA